MARPRRHPLRRVPSPAMGLAFVALVAALAGTAAALPGSNTVTGGDVTNGAVKTQDIQNSTVRGRDVRNNTLTGSDVNEGSLGQVPRAGTANTAGAGSVAGAAPVAGAAATAGTTAGIFRSAQIRANAGDDVPIATLAGFTLRLLCGNGTTLSGSDADVVLENVSAGDDAHFDADNREAQDLDEGAQEFVANEDNDATRRTTLAASGPGGSLTAVVSITAEPDGGLDVADCLAHVFAGTSQ